MHALTIEQSVLANGFSTTNLFGMHQEIILLISQKKTTNKQVKGKNSNFAVNKDHNYKESKEIKVPTYTLADILMQI